MKPRNSSKNPALKRAPKTPCTLKEIASEENTSIGLVLLDERDAESNEFLDTLAALQSSPMFKYMREDLNLPKRFDPFRLELLATRMYLAGRIDPRDNFELPNILPALK